MIPKHGGSVKQTNSYTRRRHEERIENQKTRIKNHKKMIELAAADHKNGTGEAQVVIGAQLGVEIRSWTKTWMASRSQFENVMGPMDWLSEKTGIHTRRISAIANDEIKTVGLSQAENLLLAMDRDYMLSNDEIHVIPNPNWSLEKWTEHMKQAGCM